MFRFAQQSHVIKGRLPNQLVNASARNSFNHSIRFNSAVSIERQDGNTAQSPAAKSNAQVNSAANRVRHLTNQLNTTSNIKQAYNSIPGIHTPLNNASNTPNSHSNTALNPDSPWYHKLRAFDECVSQSLTMSRNIKERRNFITAFKTNPLFWDSITKAMNLYYELVLTPDLKSDRVSRLIHLLHNGLRTNRNQLTQMNKKPDYDSQSFHKEMTNYLCKSLRDVTQDILENKAQVNEYGAMHLITAFKELMLYEEAVNIWKSCVSNTDTYTANVFLNPRVVGVVLPILYDNGVPYPEIQTLYEKSSAMLNYLHPNLTVGMIRASLSAGENEKALNLFQKLCETSTDTRYGYLIETHLSFIGECKDLNVARMFFEKALNNEMPYKIDLQVSYVKSFLKNIWHLTHDFEYVYDIWYRAATHYGRNVSHGISSSLNDTFFDIFFQNYAEDKVKGFQSLQNIIQTYNNIKPIDEPFFNIILTKCVVWQDREIIDHIDKSYELYHIPKTIVAYRILLKSMGSVNAVSNDEILKRWIDLVQKCDSIGQSFIANADWAALRDATVTWTQSAKDNTTEHSSPSSSSNLSSVASSLNLLNEPNHDNLDMTHPAVQAANASGAFDEFHHSNNGADDVVDDKRIKLYLKVIKNYSQYCRDANQLARLTTGASIKYPILKKYLPTFKDLDANDIPMPELHNLVAKPI